MMHNVTHCLGMCIWTWIAGAMLLGCDSGSPSTVPRPSPTKIDVLAIVYPLAEMVKRVGGEHVEVQWLAESGQRPEEIEATAELRQRANKAALVLTSGPWDAWAGTELSSDARSTRLIDPQRTAAAAGADPKANLWLNPAVMQELLDKVRARLTQIDPLHEADYRKNAQAYAEEIDEIDRNFRDELAKLKGKKILAVRPIWGALCARYGLSQLAPMDAREEKLSPTEFKELARAAKGNGVKFLFIDAATPAGVRQQIEEKTGLRAVTLDSLGTSAVDGRSTWARIMRYDLEQLKQGLE
jgi:zinc transport system substrate-binding protein